MSSSPNRDSAAGPCRLTSRLVLAVLAPFGTDEVLSTYPNGQSQTLLEHPLVAALRQVAATGVHVVALVDRVDEDTTLVEIPAGNPGGLALQSWQKQDMRSPVVLISLLAHAQRVADGRPIVLTLEGHGAGFLPDLDARVMTLSNETLDGQVEWRLGAVDDSSTLRTAPYLPDGTPYIESGSPVLPMTNPTSPTNHVALSTWGLGDALREAGKTGLGRIAVIHLNNCFNMSVELLHTISPYAEYATGYCNYNFFTAGQAYPAVFQRLAAAGSATSEELAQWFAAENHKVLLAAGHEPTVAGTVELSRMRDIAEKVDDLADALLACLRTASSTERPVFIDRIRQAIIAAQQYDSRPDYILETPDELTDLDSFAYELMKFDFAPYKVHQAADALRSALSGIKQYGDVGTPWMAPGELWDFSSKNLAMNIFLPDPLLNGLWDWRSQYYLDVNPDPSKPQVQRNIIDFLKVTDWVDFLIEYHKDAPFVGLLPAQIPEFPVLHKPFNARCPHKPCELRPQGGLVD